MPIADCRLADPMPVMVGRWGERAERATEVATTSGGTSVVTGGGKSDAALREMARREWARRSLLRFCSFTWPNYQFARHLEVLAGALEEVERGECTRLMVFMPPRHGKSEMCSMRFPAWFLGKHPDKRVILTSYAASLAHSFGRQVRNLVQSREFGLVFGEMSAAAEPVEVAADSRSAQAWDLAGHRGGMVSAGVGGGITGKGAHLLIIDDPVKDRADAESAATREAVWLWYTSTAYTRLEDGGAIVVMMTRWHEDDLAGRLLRAERETPGADRWRVVCLPAVKDLGLPIADFGAVVQPGAGAGTQEGAEAPTTNGNAGHVQRAPTNGVGDWRRPGEALWPEKYPRPVLDAIKANIGSYDWEALYQQQPMPPGGGLVKREWLPVVPLSEVAGREDIRWVRYWDLAVSTKNTADFSASVHVGLSNDGVLFLADGMRGRLEWPHVRRQIVSWGVSEPGTAIGVEAVAYQLAAFQELLQVPELAGRAIYPVPVTKDKLSRALPWIARAEAGRVRLVAGPWAEEFVEEAVAFPRGRHDDMVDSVSGGVEMVTSMVMTGKLLY